MLIAYTELLLQVTKLMDSESFLNAENPFYQVRNALSEGVTECILGFVLKTLRLFSQFERKKLDHYRHYLE